MSLIINKMQDYKRKRVFHIFVLDFIRIVVKVYDCQIDETKSVYM